jgi:tetratricopeptide (TPR) repeat protein
MAPAGAFGLSSAARTGIKIDDRASASGISLASVAPTPSRINRDAATAAHRLLTAGDALMAQGQAREALHHYQSALAGLPETSELHYKIACAAWAAGEFSDIETHLLTAGRLNPRDPVIHEALALWYLRVDRPEEALRYSAASVALQPGNLNFVVTHADAMTCAGQHETAWKWIAPWIAAGTRGPWLARIYARLAPKIGHETRALAFLQRTLESRDLTAQDRSRVHFAAAGLLDRMGKYDQAFEHATQANHCGRNLFDTEGHSRAVSARIDYFTGGQVRSLPRAMNRDRRPVLIVGMPRSGTSLVEQILASHPAVFGGGELSTLSECAESAATARWSERKTFPECFDLMSLSHANELAARYLSRIDSFNTAAAHVTDKMPMNYLFLGAAELLLPGCRVINCMRDPRDTCLSCYFIDFAARGNSGFDLPGLARLHSDYRRLMDHWKKVLTLPILDVQYEDLVADQQGQTRRMLEFLNLPWDDRCLSFHQTRRPVATASREQVRQPIYASSVGRWKNYEKHFGPGYR